MTTQNRQKSNAKKKKYSHYRTSGYKRTLPSAHYYDDDDSEYGDDRERDRRADHRRTGNTSRTNAQTHRGRTPLPAPQVVVDQPFPGVR